MQEVSAATLVAAAVNSHQTVFFHTVTTLKSHVMLVQCPHQYLELSQSNADLSQSIARARKHLGCSGGKLEDTKN